MSLACLTPSKQPIPGNLYYAIHELQERTVKREAAVLYNTAHLPATNSLCVSFIQVVLWIPNLFLWMHGRYYANHTEYKFKAKILEVFPNVSKNMVPNIIVLDQSHFYPTSGGQENDTGSLTINGTTHKVVDVIKVNFPFSRFCEST